MPFSQHSFYYPPVILIRLFLDLAPPDSFPDGANVEWFEEFIVLLQQREMTR
jgi:hypothetical protein